MNISFDLDNTLIPNGSSFAVEPIGRIARLLGIEELRKGTRDLVSELKSRGYEIHIYTTSFRSRLSIRLMFLYYGIRVNRIINQSLNQRQLKKLRINCSKYPPAFGFDIHIDDSKGVGIEGERLNFRSIIIEPDDYKWHETILKKLTSFTI